MRRAAQATARILLAAVLLAAVLDLPLPASSRPRLRLHLIDRSASVQVPGPDGSLTLANADEIRKSDRPADGAVLWASFGKGLPAFESVVVDGSGSDLSLALETALGRDPTEIVVHTDGRADPGRGVLLCRARGVPVHVLPLGPSSVRDVRFLRIGLPGEVEPGAPAPVEVAVVSTFATPARVTLDGQSRDLALSPGAPQVAVFPDVRRGPHVLRIDAADDVPQNNESAVLIRERSGRRRVAVHPPVPLAVPGFDVDRIPPEQLPDHVRGGGGLLLHGGPGSFAMGGWTGSPLDAISPLRSTPDRKVAAVFGIDVSGSMAQDERLETVKRAAEDARDFFGEGDRLIPMVFARDARILDSWERLRRERPEGETHFVAALRTAASRVVQEDGRRHILLLTDGVASEKETAEERKAAFAALGLVGLTVMTVDRMIPEFGTNVKIGDAKTLEAEIRRVLAGIREVERKSGGRIDPQAHPAVAGVPPFAVPYLNLTAPRPDAQVAATYGAAPAVYPAVAFRVEGAGRVAAFAFEAAAAPPRLLAQAVDLVAGPAARGPRLSADPPFVRARGAWASPRIGALAAGLRFELLQVRSDLWEGRLPDGLSGAVELTLETGASTLLSIPCPPEYEHLGVDPAALDRLAAAGGGRVLTSTSQLSELPPPAPSGTRGGRSVFLFAGILLLFAELAITTFWKAS